MSILSFIGSIFSPAADLIDNIHTSDEERMKLRNELAKIQAGVQDKLIDLEGKMVEADAKIRQSEAQSPHKLTALWRPISALALVAIIILASFGICHPDDKLYMLANVIIGGYMGGRSLEKISSTLKLGK